MDKKNVIIATLVMVILITGGAYAYDKISDKILERNQQAYLIGVQDGQLQFYNSILQSLSKEGEVILPVTLENNQTTNVKLVIDMAE